MPTFRTTTSQIIQSVAAAGGTGTTTGSGPATGTITGNYRRHQHYVDLVTAPSLFSPATKRGEVGGDEYVPPGPPAFTPPTFAGSFSNAAGGTNQLSVTLPTIVGTQLVLIRMTSTNATVGRTHDGVGWTELTNFGDTGTVISSTMYGKMCTSADSGAVITFTQTTGRHVILGRVYNNAGGLPDIFSQTFISPSTTDFSTPAITTVTPENLLVAWQSEQADLSGGKATFTVPSGATDSVALTNTQNSGSNISMGSYDMAAPTPDTYGPYAVTASLTGQGRSVVSNIPGVASEAPPVTDGYWGSPF